MPHLCPARRMEPERFSRKPGQQTSKRPETLFSRSMPSSSIPSLHYIVDHCQQVEQSGSTIEQVCMSCVYVQKYIYIYIHITYSMNFACTFGSLSCIHLSGVAQRSSMDAVRLPHFVSSELWQRNFKLFLTLLVQSSEDLQGPQEIMCLGNSMHAAVKSPA